MFRNHVLKFIDFDNHNKLIIKDNKNLNSYTHYVDVLLAHGFDVYFYKDDLNFRVNYENKYNDVNRKNAIVVNDDAYIPFDVIRKSRFINLSIKELFSGLDSNAIDDSEVDYDLLTVAYRNVFIGKRNYAETKAFITNDVQSKQTVNWYISELNRSINCIPENTKYEDWFDYARIQSIIKKYALKYGLVVPNNKLDESFKQFVFKEFGKLSTIVSNKSPILVSKVMDYIVQRSRKFAFIVMDGMSLLDWNIISDSFSDIKYSESNAFAMIPTITSISRQCLLSNKYPVQLINPWSQSKEKQEFVGYARSAGYFDHQISYQRGYEVELNPNIQCLAIVINDIDDMVHGQTQSIEGMYNDVSLMTKQGKLAKLTNKLLKDGFDVYISADHGNTSCTGVGSFKTGVETETKSKRMLVLKDIANKEALLNKYPLLEYPKYYLDKQYDYLVCDNGISFDNKGEKVMTHGGISIEEVIVPFIIIKSEDNNG